MTADPRRARVAAARMASLVLPAFDDMRRMLDIDNLTHDQAAALTDEEIAALDAEAKARLIERFERLNRELMEEVRLLEMEDRLRQREVEDFQAAVRELKEEKGRERDLRLQAANAKLLKVAALREKAASEAPQGTPPTSSTSMEADPLAGLPEQARLPWWDVIPLFFADKPQTPENEENYRREFGRLAEVVGKELALGAVRRPHLDDYHDHLLAVAKPRKGNRILSAAAQGRCLSHIKSFFDWSLKKEWIERNPAAGLAPKGLTKRETLESKRRPFTPAELEVFFHQPLFTGCESEHRLKRPGKHMYRGGKYWLPILACFTGGRLAELCELQVKDVKRWGDGMWYANIALILEKHEGDVIPEGYAGEVATATGRRKKAKTPRSRRLIPLHPDLLALGFLDFVESRRQAGGRDALLFDEVSNYGPIFNRNEFDGDLKVEGVLASAGIKFRDTSFHSFRHAFNDAVRDTKVDGQLLNRLMGHAPIGSSKHYGSQLTPGEAEKFLEFRFPTDLGHLRPATLKVQTTAPAPKPQGGARKRVLVPGKERRGGA